MFATREDKEKLYSGMNSSVIIRLLSGVARESKEEEKEDDDVDDEEKERESYLF